MKVFSQRTFWVRNRHIRLWNSHYTLNRKNSAFSSVCPHHKFLRLCWLITEIVYKTNLNSKQNFLLFLWFRAIDDQAYFFFLHRILWKGFQKLHNFSLRKFILFSASKNNWNLKFKEILLKFFVSHWNLTAIVSSFTRFSASFSAIAAELLRKLSIKKLLILDMIFYFQPNSMIFWRKLYIFWGCQFDIMQAADRIPQFY